MPIDLPSDYAPTRAEAFMNPLQAEYFRRKLQRLRANARQELVAEPLGADQNDREGDQTDRASAAEDREFGLINRERAHALLAEIDQALARLDNGTFGYCEDTGEPIDLRRLEAQPTATLTTAAQAAREQR